MTICTASIEVKSLKSVVALADKMTKKMIRKGLNNVSISLNGAAVIRWSDLEFDIQTSLPCDHWGEDQTVIAPAGEILQILRGTKSKRIQIETESGLTPSLESVFSSGSISRKLEPFTRMESVTNIKGETVVTHTLPETRQIDFSGEMIHLDAANFVRSIKALTHAIDMDCARYALGGVHMEFSQGGVDLVSTDSMRLAIRSKITRGDYECKINVPFQALKNFMDLLPKKIAGEITIYLREYNGGHMIVFQWEETAIQTPEIQGRFPRYQDVIPRCENSACINRLELLSIMEEMHSSQEDENRGIDIKISSDLMTVKGTGMNRNSFKQLPIHCPGRVKFTIDPKFMADALKSIESPEVIFEFNDGENAMVVKSPIPGIHLEVLMPISRD